MEQSLGGVLLGTSGPDRIEATAEDQALRGLGGADVLISRFNGSSLLGGAGADILRTEVSVSAPDEGAVSLNAATAQELTALPGVGAATAAAIVAHREANGPFRSVDGLLDVKGIGPAKLEAMRAQVVL